METFKRWNNGTPVVSPENAEWYTTVADFGGLEEAVENISNREQ